MPDAVVKIEQQRSTYDEPMLRVVANSNTVADQQIKEQIVRDLQQINYIDIENPQIIEQLHQLFTTKYAHIPIELKVGDNLVPPKWMNHIFYPQTTHKSLVIEIGQGRGENWFCTMFPTVCGKQDRDKVRFKWWEWLKGKWD